jgi:hypothetical protein
MQQQCLFIQPRLLYLLFHPGSEMHIDCRQVSEMIPVAIVPDAGGIQGKIIVALVYPFRSGSFLVQLFP